MTRALVTGGAGFIGSHLVDRLVESGFATVVVDNLSAGNKENVNEKATFYRLDLGSSDLVQVIDREKPEVVFHLAAQVSVSRSITQPVRDAEINILSFLKLLEALRDSPQLEKIIFSSSAAVYGNDNPVPTPENHHGRPTSPYAISKLAEEHYLQFFQDHSKTPCVILRYANVYGPRQDPSGEGGVVAIFIHKMVSGQDPTVHGDGSQTRDFVFVADVVEANIAALVDNVSGVFNVCTGGETSVEGLFDLLREHIDPRIAKVHGPERSGDIKRSALGNAKAREILGWQPEVKLEEGLMRTIRWFRETQ